MIGLMATLSDLSLGSRLETLPTQQARLSAEEAEDEDDSSHKGWLTESTKLTELDLCESREP